MLHELFPQLGGEKARDLLQRLDSKKIDQALPAEIELSLLWSLSRLGELEVEPYWWGDSYRPDAYTEGLFPTQPAAIEIAAISDNSISGEEAMDRVALQMSNFVNKAKKGLGDRIYYRFQESSGYVGRSYFRHVLAPKGYVLTPFAANRILDWIRHAASLRPRLHIVESGLNVELEETEHKQIRYHNVWSTMPPETHSIDDNPLFEVLRRKLDQLKAAPSGCLRLIFLGDVGSSLLNRLGRAGEIDHTRRRMSAREIISTFVLRYHGRVDGVVAFSPQRKPQIGYGRDELVWNSFLFAAPNLELDVSRLALIREALPRPRFEGYQVRSLFRQGAFVPTAQGWYTGVSIYGKAGGEMNAKVSARAFMDFLAGKTSPEQFRRQMGQRKGEANLFLHWLNLGLTLSDVKVEPGGLDEDDDYLILTFSDDPSARKLRIGVSSGGEREPDQ